MFKKIFIPIIFLLCLILIGFLSLTRLEGILAWMNENSLQKNPSSTPISYSCTRTERYDNPPEFDRALSLIYQRMGDAYAQNSTENPAAIVPCLEIKYTNSLQNFGADGYFLFSDESADPNKLTIYVDNSYKESDDILTALLLAHEMRHAQQFLDHLNGKKELSCMDKEVEAFFQESMFISMLNPEELNSLATRATYYQNNPYPQIAFVSQYYWIAKRGIEGCNSEDVSCKRDGIIREIRNMVINNPGYQQQCASES